MTPLRLALIVASTRTHRMGPAVARWFAGEAERWPEVGLDVIDLAETRLPDVLSDERGDAVQAVAARLSEADAFVVVTPEYNHSFPAPLKTLIDWHFREWHAKPVGFVSYGGSSGGLRAVEQLRQIFAEVHAMTVRDSVSFHGVWSHFAPDGTVKDPERPAKAASAMMNQLVWWGQALREAKAVRPYEG